VLPILTPRRRGRRGCISWNASAAVHLNEPRRRDRAPPRTAAAAARCAPRSHRKTARQTPSRRLSSRRSPSPRDLEKSLRQNRSKPPASRSARSDAPRAPVPRPSPRSRDSPVWEGVSRQIGLNRQPAAGQSAPGGASERPGADSRREGMGGGNSRRRRASLWHIGCSPLLAAARVRIRLLCARGPDVEGTDCPGSCRGEAQVG